LYQYRILPRKVATVFPTGPIISKGPRKSMILSRSMPKRDRRGISRLYHVRSVLGGRPRFVVFIYISCEPSSVASESGGASRVLFQRSGLVGIYRRCCSIVQFLKCASYMRTLLCSRLWIGNIDLVSLHGCILCRHRRRVSFCGDSLTIAPSAIS
jgi:hypothetical protein